MIVSDWGQGSCIEGLVTWVLHHAEEGRARITLPLNRLCSEMEGNELSYSEYLKCNNACVKVTIYRYSPVRVFHVDASVFNDLMSLVRYDPSPRFCRSVVVRNFMFHEVIKDVKRLATFGLKPSYPQRLFQSTEHDFEPQEIHHGSGFLIADNFVITSWHVIEEAMRDETLVIRILNETIGELPCVVVHFDPSNDLALLYCHDLDLKRHGICPFALSGEALWPSLSVFSFGYPLTHTENSALFVKGYVSGLKKRYGNNRNPFWVLNCDLNGGNSGGPVLRRIGDDINVVGVVAQKHKKEILTLEELSILEEERSTLQRNSASDSKDQFWKSVSLKMYDALNETHCQFGYGNVVPGHVVVEFLSDPSVTSIMDFIKEMELSNEFDVQG